MTDDGIGEGTEAQCPKGLDGYEGVAIRLNRVTKGRGVAREFRRAIDASGGDLEKLVRLLLHEQDVDPQVHALARTRGPSSVRSLLEVADKIADGAGDLTVKVSMRGEDPDVSFEKTDSGIVLTVRSLDAH